MTQTVQTGSTSNPSIYVNVFVGPETINIGDYGICQSYTLENNQSDTGLYPAMTGCTIGGTPFTIDPGGTDLDVFTLDLVDIFTTTTTTDIDLLTQDYELVGIPAAVPAPEPATWALLGGGLLGMLWPRRKPLFKKRDLTRGSAAG